MPRAPLCMGDTILNVTILVYKFQLFSLTEVSGVARPVMMWKHKIGARCLGVVRGPQWVQGKALVGGPGGEAPRKLRDFRK